MWSRKLGTPRRAHAANTPPGACRKREAKKEGIIFVISGPSGSGKTTLIKKLLNKKELKHDLARIITCTTRLPRKGERNGRDYIFLKRKEFVNKIKHNEFLEWQKVLGAHYGTPKALVVKKLSAGCDVILCIDVKGARALKKEKKFRFVYIFIMPSERDWHRTLKARLKARLSDSDEEIKNRLRLARQEVKQAKYYNHIIVNKDITAAVKKLKEIIVTERAKGD